MKKEFAYSFPAMNDEDYERIVRLSRDTIAPGIP